VKKAPKPDEQATGVVVWAIEVTNQREEAVAVYDILTLVAQRDV
jgi:oxepin-CoA hydrolase/3-oxo-5,6-dehydrosuberyl-CoA semialdehyde dehydrogenase